MIKGVILDLYQTIGIFPERITMKQVSKILLENGYEAYPQSLDHALGYTVFIEYPRMGFKTNEEIFRRTLKHLDIEIDNETMTKIQQLYNNSHFVPFDDSEASVNQMKKMGLKTAIATTTPKCWFAHDIPKIVELMDFVCTGYEAGVEKSNPRIFKVIFEKLGLKPSETVVVGDRVELDIENSKLHGCKTILITRKGEHPETDLADAKVTSLLEAVDVISSWNRV